MTTFAQLAADVVTATARPELVATGDISLAIRRAVLKLHSMAFWPQDLAETSLVFADSTKVNQVISIANDLPRFRAIKYIREYFPGSATTAATYDKEKFYERLDPDFILDNYGQTRSGIWYLGGATINLRSRVTSNAGGVTTAVPGVIVGWYQYPLVADLLSFNSWIADCYPFAVVDEAAATIFRNTGNLDMAAAYDRAMAEHKLYLLQNFIDGEGR